ncbi:hypothetical protein [Actinomycetospora sp. NBRC 106378]|uniref:hypothetical protein n=1 Tax=Actinomycetospora sp. NBRC 106378 TaxID=3032208 RepID=UPI002553699E|nr:hypothetical protein [Actinomycetospora sp. NBRC 106378]
MPKDIERSSSVDLHRHALDESTLREILATVDLDQPIPRLLLCAADELDKSAGVKPQVRPKEPR